MTALLLRQANGGSMGGLEIRRFAQKYMGYGLGISISVHFLLLATYYISTNLIERIPAPSFTSFPIILEPLPPPAIYLPDDPLLKLIQSLPPASIAGIPKPSLTEIPDEAPFIPTQSDLNKMQNDRRDSLLGDIGTRPGFIIQPLPVEDPIPPASTFTPYEQKPKLVSMVQPAYPPMAQQAAVSGRVWVKYYVDKKGEVREVVVVKAVPTALGFEEETVKAVKQWKFTPAIQDQRPVGVWVSQTVMFKVK